MLFGAPDWRFAFDPRPREQKNRPLGYDEGLVCGADAAVTSLHRDFLPSSWTSYQPTPIELSMLIGSFGLFFTLFLPFRRLLPVVAIGRRERHFARGLRIKPGAAHRFAFAFPIRGTGTQSPREPQEDDGRLFHQGETYH